MKDGHEVSFISLFPFEDGEAAQFSWLRRMKIAIGITQSLRYLHTESRPPFAISELKSNSVYVTEDFTPKTIADNLTEIILMSRLTMSSIEAPPATRRESSNLYMGVGTQIRVASLHKAMSTR
uniref:Protein kinase domain-containing protein n=1 Tax=Aegilops tauschii TaxID=37682 RepID=R7W9V6_AEGTA